MSIELNAGFSGKNALVCGLARSGYAAAKLLSHFGAAVTVSDLTERDKFKSDREDMAAALEQSGIKLYLGKNPDEIVRKFDLIVISPGIPCDLPFLDKARRAGIPVFGEIELAYRVCKSPIIGITGTNGKTTATTLAGDILRRCKPHTETVGNIGRAFCESALNIPPSAFAVCELSSFQLETIQTFRPRVACVLNITEDHLNRHKTMEGYVAAKERIFLNQTRDDYLVLNYDDKYCRDMADKTASKTAYFSIKEEVPQGVFISGGEMYLKYGAYYEKILDISELQTPFTHIVGDMAAAALVSVLAGAPLDAVRDVLRAFKGVEHRVEYVATVDGADYYNDSKATNTDAAIKALEAINKPVVLIGGGKDKGADFSDWVKLFDGKVRHVVVFGETADMIIETCKAYGFAAFDKVNSLRGAVDLCRTKAMPGDCVLLSPACASLDMFDNYEERGNIFKEFVLSL